MDKEITMKRIFLLGAITVFVISFGVCGCGNKKTEKMSFPKEIESGSYLLFQTDDVDEYLNFLNRFDEDKYEIVNIDTFVYETSSNYDNEYYMITYKKIE